MHAAKVNCADSPNEECASLGDSRSAALSPATAAAGLPLPPRSSSSSSSSSSPTEGCPFVNEFTEIAPAVFEALCAIPNVVSFGVPIREHPRRIRVTIDEEADFEQVVRAIMEAVPDSRPGHFRFEVGRYGTFVLQASRASTPFATAVATNAGDGITPAEQAALELRLKAELDGLTPLAGKGGASAVRAELVRRYPTRRDFYRIGRNFYCRATVRTLCRLLGLPRGHAELAFRHLILVDLYGHLEKPPGDANQPSRLESSGPAATNPSPPGDPRQT